MDMPVIIEVVDPTETEKIFKELFDYFIYIDNTFSPFKKDSELTKINQGRIRKKDWSRDMKEIFELCKQTKNETKGYFNYEKNNQFDPLGLVKGWAINKVANILKSKGFKNFYVEAGGDIQVAGTNRENKFWRIGIQNPFNLKQNIKVISLNNQGVATSGTYLRGQHIINPFTGEGIKNIVSLTVIGPNIYEADRFATSAFAMGKKGINFIENLTGFAGYMIDNKGIATYTSNFNNYVHNN